MDDGCVSCKISPVLHVNTNSLSLSTLFFLREFQSVALFWDHPWPLSTDDQSNFPSVRGVSNEYFWMDFCAELMYSNVVFSWKWIEFYSCFNGIIGQANGELTRRPSGVWSFAGRSKRISEISIKLCCFCSSPSLKSRLNQHWRRFFFFTRR